MSLTVCLRNEGVLVESAPKIYIRADGQTKEISREEWDALYPGREPVVMLPEPTDVIYEANITHNLARMSVEADLYAPLWEPTESLGVTCAGDLIPHLVKGLKILKSDRSKFEVFNPVNGWGSYDDLISFVSNYISACSLNPTSTISVSR